MARIGINPARGKTTGYRPERVTVAVLTYIPDLSGYFEGRLQVLQLVIDSLHANTTLPHEVMVFDNGSCPQVVDYLRRLRDQGQVDYLILSQRNIGKIDAFRILFQAAPGEIIAYNDDDILFYPGWLEAHLEILDAFPHVGMVSGVPVRNAALHAHHSLDRLAAAGAPGLSVERQRRIPVEWEADWAASTGRDAQAHLQDTADHLELIFKIDKADGSACEAIGSANHFQFVTPKAAILQALPAHWTGKMMGHMVELDEALDQLGYLRLSTVERYTRHLGNALSAEVIQETLAMGLTLTPGPSPHNKGEGRKQRHWMLRIPGARRLLSALYNRIFQILYR